MIPLEGGQGHDPFFLVSGYLGPSGKCGFDILVFLAFFWPMLGNPKPILDPFSTNLNQFDGRSSPTLSCNETFSAIFCVPSPPLFVTVRLALLGIFFSFLGLFRVFGSFATLCRVCSPADLGTPFRFFFFFWFFLGEAFLTPVEGQGHDPFFTCIFRGSWAFWQVRF